MADGEITWGGLTLGGDTDYNISEIAGWEDLGDISDVSEARSRGHGDHVGDLFSRARIVTVTGQIADTVNRDELAHALEAATPVSSVVADLTVDLLGRTLTAGARVLRRSIAIGRAYTVGEVPFTVQWRCPDPLRYGPVQATVSTGLPTSGGGLTYPTVYNLSYGAAGNPGQITLTNAGTAPAPIVFTVVPPAPAPIVFTVVPPASGGFEISASGRRLTYPVSSAETLTIDTAAGTVLAEGTADRRGNLTNADWLQVPPGSSLTVQFTALGAYDPAASLSVSGFRSAYW